ncbi:MULTISPECIES: hypothetical protein [unclassified Gordonia (in: high G+C Gram-positive bacteria)]|nr:MULTISPECIES: hypothetical protein [unclassified Gordonia (in: high G+C Gram-positive bacteria)]UQE73570.1 hypothetical protein MYK68_12505 [Gordonia sp. PP30]
MSDDLDRLRRWVESGALFRVLASRGGTTTVALLTCDGGEEMGRLVSDDPRVAQWCAANPDAEASG